MMVAAYLLAIILSIMGFIMLFFKEIREQHSYSILKLFFPGIVAVEFILEMQET